MATFGAIASPNPNVLFDPARAMGAAQDQQRNALLMEATQTRMANDVQDRQIAEFERDREDAGRLAGAVLQLPAEEQARAYESAIADYQRQGRMTRSPAKFDDIGAAGLKRAAEMLITPKDRLQLDEKRQGTALLMGLLGGVVPGASVPSVPTAAPGGAPVRAPAGNPLVGPIPPEMLAGAGVIPPPGDPGRNAALEAQRDANLGADPVTLAAASAARGATGAPQLPGGYRSPDGVAGQYAGLAPPTGVINPNIGGGAAPAAPAGPDEGALRAQAAQLRQRALAASTIGSPAAAAAARALEQQATALEGQIMDGRRVARDAKVDERQAATDARLAAAQERQADADRRRAEREGIPSGYQRKADGGLEPIPGGPADPAMKAKDAPAATEAERKAGSYLERMQGAEQLLESMVKDGYDPGNIRDRVAGATPLVGNFLTTDKGQQYLNAAAEWARAKLRLESGAVIGEEEAKAEARTYFPMPGDSPATIAQKKALRETATSAVRRQAGRADPGAPAAAAAGERPPLSSFGR